MTTNFTVNGRGINTMFAAAGAADGSNNTLTGYTTGSGTAIKFLKPFYTGISSTSDETTYNGDARMYATTSIGTANFLSNSANIKFCPPYVFFSGNANSNNSYTAGTTATYNVEPPAGVTRMLVILVGGGGGGGGGGSKSGGGAGGGGGGGSGAITIFSINIASGIFTINVGYGGLYGYTRDNQGGGPGDEDNSSPNASGFSAGPGTATSFTYNNASYFANSGYGGGGGTSSTGGTAGVAATVNMLSIQIYSFTGNNGNAGSTGASPANVGGTGGKPKYGNIINTNLLNLISNQVSLNSNNISTSTKLQYGEGGNGGKGDNASSFGWNGEFGAPGCAFVFYFYN